jgi:protein-S-isoprenylcysteine O-methyltransferase Ste14
MLHMIPLSPVGLPGLAIIAISFVSFVIALLIARRRTGVPDAGQGQRSEKSWGGIAVQTIGIFSVGFGPIMVSLDPLGAPALLQALVVGLFMASAIWLFAASSRAMGSNWAIVASTRSDHELVTSGPFAYVRNPIYVALFLFMIAMAVAYGHYAGLIAGVPLYIIGTMMRVSIEERLLRTQFGTAYDAYAARVKRFVPGLV